MNDTTYGRLKENLERLKLKHTLQIIDNYLERAIKDDINMVEVLDHLFMEEAKYKNQSAIEQQIRLSGFPMRKTLDNFDFTFQPSIDRALI